MQVFPGGCSTPTLSEMRTCMQVQGMGCTSASREGRRRGTGQRAAAGWPSCLDLAATAAVQPTLPSRASAMGSLRVTSAIESARSCADGWRSRG